MTKHWSQFHGTTGEATVAQDLILCAEAGESMSTNGVNELQSLLTTKGDLCVSIFFPTYHRGADIQQNRIRFKTLIHNAKLLLVQKGWKNVRADNFLQPLKSLLRDQLFWQHPTEGLAFFLNPDLFLYYRLPFHFQEQVMVDERFLIRPLLPLLGDNHDFFVLALSENGHRFFRGSVFDFEEITVKSLPQNLHDAVRFNDPERQLQLHTQTPRIPGSRAAAIFHGHGVGIDDEKDDLQEYCRQVDRGLHGLLKDETAPLVVAAVDALFSMYSGMNTYPGLMEEAIPGNPELLSNKELRDRAWGIVSKHFAIKAEGLLKKYDDLAGTNQVTNNVEEILNAAHQGRIQYLLVNSKQPWWGCYREETGQVESHEIPQAGDTEIANLALIQTLRTDGKVYELEPNCSQYSSLLAIYRY